MNQPTRPDLCLILDAVVAREASSGKSSGTLSVGVSDGSEQCWWSVDLARVEHAAFSEAPNRSADCIWVLGEREARAVLSGETLAAEANTRVYGDRAVLERFRRNYFSSQTILALRASA